ncbi:MAG: 4Fe-4S dicluster domain-containing protein [Clostridiales bacterium]|nr:4Fe-4S dicluster domain-containing protein [Clostridiales bacterium]
MRPDTEGFLYPVVDAEKCVRCLKCVKGCPVKRVDGEKVRDE